MKSKPLRIKPSDLARMSTGLHDPVQLLEALEDRREEKRPTVQDAQDAFEPPRTPVEELVAGIWAQVLGVERVGIRDVFFELGGHSLLATQVLSRLRDACKVDLPLRSFFQHPTVAGLAEAVEKARRGPSGPEIPPLSPVSRQERLPLSFAQQRLWFLHQLEPESAAYHIPTALRLEGALDVPVFRTALAEVVRRHETLRTTFPAVDGEPAQAIAAPAAVPVPVVDLSGLPEDRREAHLRLLVREDALRLFDLARGPVFRVSLAKLDPAQHVALVTLHHIAGDGWSMEVLVREMAALYESFAEGKPSPLPELPVQYADFTVWQRGWLAGQVLEDEVAWWRERLRGLPPLLELPLDHPRPAVQTHAGGGRPLRLPAELVRRVRRIAHREGSTLFMALLAAFDALLSRTSGRTDLAVGTPVAGRHHLETEKQIGFFANTLVLRADLADGPGLRGLVARVRDAVLEALAHQDLPFERLVEELQPQRDLSYSPLFQVMFELQNRPLGQLQVRGLSFRPLRMERDTAQFDLTLSLLEGESDLTGMLTFDRDLFEAPTIERMAGHFLALLEALAAEPDRRFTEAPLWSEAERHQILRETNDTAVAASGEEGLSALFAAQARRAPDAVAAVAGEERLTYGALAARVGGLARALAGLGVGPELRVALLAERGLPLLTAVLAVLEAGGAWLPLDPHHPAERQIRLTAQSGAVLVLAERRLAAALRQSLEGLEPAGCPPVLDLEPLFGAGAGRELPRSAGPGQLAYMIYTSGSTGVPKGAMIEHRGMMNHLLAKIADLGLTAADAVAQTASQCFDISVWQLLAPLLAGGRVHIAGDETARDPRRLQAFTEDEGITVLETVPSLLRAMLAENAAAPRRLAALRWLLVTGEACPADLAGRWLADHPEVPLLNAYGPTECSDDVTHHAIRRAPAPGADLPIGRPLRNFHLYVLDRWLMPLPLRIAGELCVAGEGVGRGYLGDPARTAESFGPDPLSALRNEPGSRLYRTGDLARLSPDGTFEFLGRLDAQVKVRGFRVEPGEIEAALGAQPGVRQAVVLARPDGSEGMRLVAWVVLGEPAARVGDLRDALRRSLPEYMIPSAFVVLESLPLTPNGKLDRRALPAPEPQVGEGEAPAARTPVEEVVLGVWADVLGRTRVAGHESFFDLGGHSLLAIQVISRVRSLLDVEVPLRVLFEKPTAARFAESVAEILRTGAGLSAPPLAPVPRDGRPLPASFAQQRLWFLHQLEPASVAYNLPAAVRLEGALDRAALRAALAEIIRRHEALRTRFGVADGAPVQVVDAAGPFDLPLVDLRALPAAAAEEQARLLVRAESRRPFDLAQGPLLRAGLVALGTEEHVLSLNMHHVIGDAWSTSVLVREVRALYEAFSQGRPSPLPELAVQYGDFAAWQRQWLSGDVLEAEIRYWRDRLGVAPPVLELPTDRPRPAVQTFRGTNCWFSLPADLSGRLQALSRDAGSTLFMTLLSAFYALLARSSGQRDLVVGTPIAGRNHLQTENLIGFFVNTLVLRADLGGDPEFGDLLRQVRELTLSAYAHQDLPFEKLVNELQPQRDLSRTPLFQVMFALQNVPAEALESPGLRLRPLPAGSGMSKFDLTGIFFGSGGEGELTGTFEYNTDLFDAATMRRLAEHFEVLLAGLAADPHRRVSELPLLTGPERAQILREWNDFEKECPQTPMVHELFAAHARQRPGATAVASPDERLTYGEVEARSNRLAHHLRALGVGPETLVAMCTDRTLERVAGIVAVLKAGGAYVSLDPTYPRERLAFLLADARAPVLLTERRFAGLLPETGAAVICLDESWESIQGDEACAPESGVTPDNLAYVVYTSGSTGKPKGVEIPHAGLMNLVRWHQDLYSVAPGDRGTQIASPAFDASIWELWPYLAGGAGVYIPDEETRLSSPGMVRWWSETGITLAYLMTPLAEGVLEVDIPPGLDLRVRALIIGGDRLHRGPDPRVGFHLMNHYGPAEYTVTSTVVRVPPQGEESGIPTIGRPIDNTRIYILDRDLHPVPVGVHGELFVAGVGLARGYLRRPDLTAEKFIPDPFAEEPGARMYRTADLVRFLPDGDIDFMGRLDHQVKLRGLRIELGEIESVLGQHPALREAAVLVREDRPGSKRLAAYVVPAEDPGPGAEDLREYLRERLPEYMIPSAFVQLAALPLTPNGKVDRRALPAPDQGVESAYVAPRDPVEERLAALWRDVLQVERIGIHDDFFELGGHSLLATQVVSRVREAFGVEIPLRALFQAPTVESFAEAMLRREQAVPAAPAIPRSALRGSTDRFPCSFAQERLWFLHQVDPEGSSYNSSWPIQVTGGLDAAALERALAEVVRRHEVLRTTFEAEGEPVQVVAASADVRLPVIDLAERPGELEGLAEEHARHRFDLGRGPLLRATLVRMGKEVHVLLLTMHHIVTDDWSMAVLVRELGVLYEAFSQGRPSPLPGLDLQYADFACWQRQRLSGEALAAELSWWREQLADLPPPLELPADRPRPAVQSFRGGSRSWRFREDLLPALHALGRRQGVTLFMTLLTAFDVLLARSTGRDDIAVGAPIAGRGHGQVEPLIGCFVNTLVLRARLDGDPGFLEALRRLQEVALGAFAHQDLPFEKLIAELQPERDLSRTPIYQVMFSLHNVPAGALAVPGVRLERLAFGSPAAKLDLILNLQETAGGLGAAVEYSRDLFDGTTVQRLLLHFEVLLEGIAADPARPLSALPLLSAAERHALLAEWNDTAEAGAGACFHEMFAAEAKRWPDAPAVLCGGERLSYGELRERSDRLAHALRRLGVGPDVRVALCFDREPSLLVGILGILAAGGAYVPLDPALPAERRAFILEDALAGTPHRLILTREALAHLLDADLPEDGGEEALPPVPFDALAYVLYTSGSTGRPKGVAVHHRGLSNYLAWSRQAYRMAEGHGAPVHSSAGFDLTVTSLLAPLAAGAPVTLLPEAEDAVASLAAALRERAGYSLVKLTPAHLRALGHVLTPGEVEGAARALVVGGEALLAEELALWRQHAPATRLINEYGPTETVVGCAVHEVSPETPGSGPVPIGRPIWNSRLYVLDRDFQPVPAGVAGEVCIGGAGVARGYLGRPDLTAERFVPSPFPAGGSGAGERLYRTGDLARVLAGGCLDYLGRTDDQVKIRGYRIEPGEIEAQLAAHPALAAAAVVVGQGPGGAPRLVACVVPAPGQAPGADELRSFLSDRLPDYMVPAAFLSLASLPLTPNGKVDRRALARLEPEPERPVPAEEVDAAPLTPVEELLLGVWKQVLRRDDVGRHDNFFELGGDSILSLQIASRARQAGVRVTSRQLFAHPTVAGLARVAATTPSPRSEEKEKPTAAEVPLTPIQRWFFEQSLSRPEHYNLSILLEVGALEGGDRVGAAMLRRAVEHLLGHHDALRLRFEPPTPERSGWRQAGGPPSGPTPFVQADLTALPQERRRAALEGLAAELQGSFRLATGPLLRAALFTWGDGEPDRLLLVAHHLVVDGVSWRILLEDVETVCRQLGRGEAASLPPATTSFQRWAERLVERVGSGVMDDEAGVWLERLADLPPPLPQDRGAGPNSVASARSVVVSLDAAETRALLQEVPRAYRTQINDVLLSALAEAFGRWTGDRRLLLELEGHGREDLFDDVFDDVDLSRTVGWLTTHFPVLLDLAGAAAPGDALKTVKEQLRAIPGRGIGWGLLRFLRADGAGEALRRLPRPEVVFNFLGQLDQSVDEGRLFRPARESAGAERHRSQERPALFEIAGAVSGDRLHVRWIYSENRHLRSTVERLAQDFVAALRSLISHCLAPGVAGCTPSDFPLARIDQAALDRLAAGAAGRIEDLYPASPMQQGMLFHALHAPGSGVYVVQIGITLHVELDVQAFEQAWDRLIERHPVMRTAFVWEGLETPLQAVSARVRPAWLHLDWRTLPEAEQERRLADHLEEDRRRGFDLHRPPLLRFCLIRLGEESYRFVWSLHHLITDGWSSPIVLRELFAFYKALAAGEEPKLGRPRPYRDYIAWLIRQDLEAAEGFWRRALAGFSAPTSLGVDRGGSAGTYGSRTAVLPADTSEGLRALSRQHQLTLNTLLQGAWALLLSRYSGDKDVVFGAVASGRSAPVEGIEEMVGLFINTLPVRARLAPEAELLAWLRDLQEQQSEVRQHEHSPLSQVQAWSEVGPGSPLFESILIFESYPVDEEVLREVGERLGIGEVRAREQTSYPVTVVVDPGRRLTLEVAWDAGRIDGPAAARMLRHLQTVLESLLDDVRRPLAAVPLLSPGERHQILHEWNDSRAGGREDLGLHELFARQAARTPDAPAVVFAGGEGDDGRIWTYDELGRWAGTLAHRLRGLGLRPGARAGLCLQRSPAALAAMLGILDAGASYVPLDPESPLERLAAIVADSGIELLLTEGRLAPALDGLPVRMLTLDAAGEPPAGEEAFGGSRTEPDGCAYVIYTSGSTGVAKGVEVTHRGAVNFVRGLLQRVPLGSGDRILLFAPLSFDASVVQIFPALASGACVVIHPNPRELTSEDLLALCEREQLTVFDLPGAVWRQWVQDVAALRRPLPTRLHTFLTGGESVPAAVFREWAGLTGRRATFLSSYGPTEATVTSSVFVTDNRPGERAWAQVPIGRPLPNVRLHVLDRWLRPSPVGAPGQLFIGGPGLARGYLGRPGATAEVFLPDPLPPGRGGEPGGRLYRTGDLARYLPDGNLEFLGRADHQVKVRGFRIELAEIETALSRVPALREAVVLLREDRPGDKRLVAYVVPQEPAAPPTVSDLRGLLAETLPPYMLPSAFVTLEAIPVLASGKVDRAALPAPDADRPDLGGAYVAPRTAEEELLARIWAQVLRVEKVGVFDNFFELGGDSILSIQIIARSSQAGLRLTPKQLFDHQTVAELARAAEAAPGVDAEQGRVSGPVPLLPIQRWFFEQGFRSPHHFNNAFLLEVRQPLAPAVLARLAEALVEHHDALRLRFLRNGDAWEQAGAASEPVAPWGSVDLGTLPAPVRREALLGAAIQLQSAGLDLARGPLTRLVSFDLGGGECRLLWVIHHLAVDGVSWRILLEDLETAWRQLAAGEAPVLPAKTTSFKRWAQRLVEHAGSDAVRAERAHWLAVAARACPPLPVDLDVDRQGARAANTLASMRSVAVSLSPEETQGLLQDVPATWHTQIDEVLLTALAQAFAGWTGSTALLVDLEGHGREPLFDDVDLSRTVGWFTTQYPVLIDPGARAEAGEALVAVKEQLRRIPGRGIGYGLLRYLSGDAELERALRQAPEAEVSFNYLGQLESGSGAEGSGSLFTVAGEPTGPDMDLRDRRPHLLEISGAVAGGQLHLRFSYSANVHRHETIERLAGAMGEALRSLIDRCRSGQAVYTASDFPLAQLDSESFRELSALLDDDFE